MIPAQDGSNTDRLLVPPQEASFNLYICRIKNKDLIMIELKFLLYNKYMLLHFFFHFFASCTYMSLHHWLNDNPIPTWPSYFHLHIHPFFYLHFDHLTFENKPNENPKHRYQASLLQRTRKCSLPPLFCLCVCMVKFCILVMKQNQQQSEWTS